MITGSMVALVTPLLADGAIDWAALDALIDWHVDAGTDAIVAVGTTGESATLTVAEHSQVIARVVAHSAGRVKVIGGTGANSTAEAIELTRQAKDAGVDACLLVTPYYNKPTQEGLYQHYLAIAEAVDIPQILYNVPGRTACDMLNETVLRLADVDNLIGIKDATGDIPRGTLLAAELGDRMAVYSGDDATACALMLAGGKGTISVTANVAPAQIAAMTHAALAGDADKAQELDAPLAALHRDLFLEANPIPVKWAMWAMGKIDSGIRLPLTPLAEQYRPNVLAALAAANIPTERA